MAVTEVNKLFAGQTGARSATSRNYEAAWMVIVDDPKDGPRIVVDAVKSWLGKSWTGFSNDVDSGAKCESLTPSRVADTRLVWIVKGTWKSSSSSFPEGGGGDGGEFDVANFRDELEVSSVKVSVPVEKATLLVALPKIGRAMNSVGPVVNAAGDVLDPPPEKEESHRVVRLTKYEWEFPSAIADAYDNTINADAFTIQKPGLTMAVQRYQAKMEPITGSLNYHTLKTGRVLAYWKNTYEIHIKKEGWRAEIVNRGRNRRKLENDPNGQGGEISGNPLPGRNNWKPPLARIRDDDDFPTGLVLLDLNGQPLKSYNKDAVYIPYGFYTEAQFGSLKL